MSKCTTCRSSCRKTTTVYVDSEHGLKRARVCNTCVVQTVRLFMGAAPSLCNCGEPATTCRGCASKQHTKTKVKLLKRAVERIMGMARIAALEGNRLGEEIFTQAANIIEAEAKRNA